MDNVLDIFCDYAIKNKLFDRVAISKILDILLKENNVDDRITYIISKNTIFDRNILGEYDMDSIIYIYYWEMLRKIRNNKHLTKFDKAYDLTQIEITAKKNLYILETILHEMEHIKQQESVKGIRSNKTLEERMYQYEINFMIPHDDIFDTGIIGSYANYVKRSIKYNRFYHLSFMERMANIKSSEEIIDMLKKLNDVFERLINIQNDIISDFINKGYEKELTGPTTKFISNIGYNYDFTRDDLTQIRDTMDFENRLRYGFMITDEEYKKRIKK